MKYLLSNTERQYLGLEPIKPDWEYVKFKGDQYRPDSTLVYENETIKRHIISTENSYQEYQYDDLTRERKYLLPKTSRGKEKKLTPSTFEKLSPKGVFFRFEKDEVTIASYTTLTTFYSTRMESIQIPTIVAFKTWLAQYINETTEKNQQQLEAFKMSKRENIRAKRGDVFAFKMDRNNYGYGQVIENIDKLRKELPKNHDMNSIMGKALLIRLFHDKTEGLLTDVGRLKDIKTTPSQYIFDNLIFYGEYPIIGNFEIPKNEIDFPISYGRVFGAPTEVQLQWGIIHKQKPVEHYNRHLAGFNELVPSGSPGYRINNPYSKSGVGWHLDIDKQTLLDCIEQNSNKPYWNQKIHTMNLDLRNPMNEAIRAELFTEFGLDESAYYLE
ncbi:MAG: immunity 26/phosphotriesterase HocA family protein [Saprospiraceae bacterium]|nr:immunity 26/phosphotriesterase HocA family protein [Saprospiraceae bacterium]